MTERIIATGRVVTDRSDCDVTGQVRKFSVVQRYLGLRKRLVEQSLALERLAADKDRDLLLTHRAGLKNTCCMVLIARLVQGWSYDHGVLASLVLTTHKVITTGARGHPYQCHDTG